MALKLYKPLEYGDVKGDNPPYTDPNNPTGELPYIPGQAESKLKYVDPNNPTEEAPFESSVTPPAVSKVAKVPAAVQSFDAANYGDPNNPTGAEPYSNGGVYPWENKVGSIIAPASDTPAQDYTDPNNPANDIPYVDDKGRPIGGGSAANGGVNFPGSSAANGAPDLKGLGLKAYSESQHIKTPGAYDPRLDVDYPLTKDYPPVTKDTNFNSETYLGGLLNQPSPAPKYNPQSEQELRGLARSNKIGEFLTLLGDTYGLAKGAPIAVRQMSSSSPYLQKILENREKYRQRMEEYAAQEFQNKVKNAMYLKAQKDAYAKDEDAYRRWKYEQDAEYARWAAGERRKNETDVELRRRWEAENELAKAKLAAKRAGSGKPDPQDRKIKIQTAKKLYILDYPVASRYREISLSDAELQKDKPQWFTKSGGELKYNIKTGKYEEVGSTLRLSSDVKDEDLMRYYLEKQERGGYIPAPRPYDWKTPEVPWAREAQEKIQESAEEPSAFQ